MELIYVRIYKVILNKLTPVFHYLNFKRFFHYWNHSAFTFLFCFLSGWVNHEVWGFTCNFHWLWIAYTITKKQSFSSFSIVSLSINIHTHWTDVFYKEKREYKQAVYKHWAAVKSRQSFSIQTACCPFSPWGLRSKNFFKAGPSHFWNLAYAAKLGWTKIPAFSRTSRAWTSPCSSSWSHSPRL